MSYWDSKNHVVVHRPSKPFPGYPGWERVDCHCCNGIEWGGEEPYECRSCGGMGMVARHIKTGSVAAYPGGPFLGSHWSAW